MRIHELIAKKEELLSEEEKTEMKTLVDAYIAESKELDKKHGMEKYSVLLSNETNIFASMKIKALVEEKKEEPAA
jgi:hypothetical protein